MASTPDMPGPADESRGPENQKDAQSEDEAAGNGDERGTDESAPADPPRRPGLFGYDPRQWPDHA